MKITTKDPKEAAYYWTLQDKFTFVNTEIIQPYGRKIVLFHFDTVLNDAEYEQLHNDFRLGACLVEPGQYAIKLSDIKGIIREKCFDR